ncbi:MAG: threonylcarbamoyl-AMP synthase [Clostridia bacterium]|nr:threonylcarbamoyl-AMP synthase [Clostridia bacterium]
METVILRVTDGSSDEEQRALQKAADCIRGSGLVAFPTETVYGLGGNAFDAEAAKKIYAAKGRPSDNPLIVHIAEPEEMDRYCYTNPLSARLAEAFWPGPMTMILPKRDCIPGSVTGGLDTVAIRLPSDPVANRLIRMAGVPVAAPSANRSGRPSPTTAEHVVEDLQGRIDMILAGNPCRIGVESSVIAVEQDHVTVLRPGAVTCEALRQLLGEDRVSVDRIVTEKVTGAFKPRSPGMKYRHYAPKAPVLLLEGEENTVVSYLKKKLPDPEAGLLVYDEDLDELAGERTLSFGKRLDPDAQAHRLFFCLRKFDSMEEVRTIYARTPRREGIGLAVYNRLAKAAGFHILKF